MTTTKMTAESISKLKAKHIKLLQDMGFHVNMDGTVQCPCPIHGGDNPTGFSYSADIDRWRCWTHQCHEEYGTDIVGLIAAHNQVSRKKAYLLYKNSIANIKDDIVFTPEEGRRKIVFPERFFDDKHFFAPYLFSRGISQEIIEQFRIFRYLADTRKPLFGRECIPIINVKDEIVGFAGRRTEVLNEETDKKWLYVPKGISLGRTLFNIQNIDTSLDYVILVEGTLDVLKLHQNGIKNVVSSFTCSLGKFQKDILLNKGIKRIIVLFDKDEAGDKGFESIQSRYSLFFKVIDGRNLLEGFGDPADMDNEYIKNEFKRQLNDLL